MQRTREFLFLLFVLMLTGGCTRSAHTAPYINFSNLGGTELPTGTPDPFLVPTRDTQRPVLTPTPDQPRPLPTLRSEEILYVVQWGDTIKAIAERYQVLPQQITAENNIKNPSLIYHGQQLIIPAPKTAETGPALKIIPDSELVYGPYTIHFELEPFLREQGGYINRYTEEIDGQEYTGPEIISRVAMEYSVNPRLLISILEHQSGWITDPEVKLKEYPLRHKEAGYEGLYAQLSWGADQLNRGYYLWRVRGIGSWLCKHGTNVPIDETINAGTAGVQHFFSRLLPHAQWRETVSGGGFQNTYADFFGYPFDYAYQPLVPPDLTQPELTLPFEKDLVWAYTGGPHGGWGSGSAWAALDFAPPPGNLGCAKSKHWVTASAPGLIVYADGGAVVQSLDGDPYAQSGWALLYMHIDSEGRVEPGTILETGDRIGHPSCEGGFSTGTHLHIARRYNGEWIPADQDLPFNLGGWISRGYGAPYQGSLSNGNQTIQAEDHRTEINLISHE
jgi:murein DD-endopeptidase MepM/ murein hydrolase activator NlpD